MSLLHALGHRLRVVLRQDRYARELQEELQFHLSLEAMQQQHGGHGALSAIDARHAARRRFGNTTRYAEETRAMAGLGFFDVVRQDARFALRSFRRAPVFTAVAVLTLAIGIGANTAIFSAVNAVLLRPLPFPEPERLMRVSMVFPANDFGPGMDDAPWSYPKYAMYRDAQQSFARIGIYTEFPVTLGGAQGAERVRGEDVDAAYLPTLGVQPALGRWFTAAENSAPGAPRLAVLGDALWQRRFNADSSVLGKPILVRGEPYTIIGVMPPGFRGVQGNAEIWMPLFAAPAADIQQPWSHSYVAIGRLKPGVGAEQATAEATELGKRVDAAWPDPYRKDRHQGVSARALDAVRADPAVRRSLLVLLGAVGIVLLIACANVANLFLLRAAGRRREIAVRLAIGAGRGRLVRQLLTESVLLSTIAGAASLLVAWWGVRLLSSLEPVRAIGGRSGGLAGANLEAMRLDLPAFAFAAALAIVTGIVFGLVPAIQATRPSLTDALKDGEARLRARILRRLSTRNALAVAEIALALVLLAGSGLMLRSLGKLLGVDAGIRPEGVLTLRLNARDGTGRDSLPGFYDRVLGELRALPGVTDVGFTSCAPLSGGCNETIILFRDRPPAAPGTEPPVGIHWVSPGWFGAAGVPLRRGRLFDSGDRLGGRKVVLLNEAAARKFWPGEDPLGRPVAVGQGGFGDTAYVVGVVGDVRYETLETPPEPDVYLSYHQSPRAGMLAFVRTAGDPSSLAAPARARLRQAAPASPVYDIRTLAERVSDATAQARLAAVLLTLFAVVALALATLGTYGVVSFAVAQRTREIGVRIALGARPGDVVRLIVRQGVVLVLLGAALGLAMALAATRAMQSLLYGVTATDPVTFGAIVVVLVGAVVVASWIPARRAAGIEPLEALREQ
jgi:putative ABC transport system permease protein